MNTNPSVWAQFEQGLQTALAGKVGSLTFVVLGAEHGVERLFHRSAYNLVDVAAYLGLVHLKRLFHPAALSSTIVQDQFSCEIGLAITIFNRRAGLSMCA